MQAWSGCWKMKSKKKQRSQSGGLLFDEGHGREQALSIQEAEEVFKTAHQVLQWSRKLHYLLCHMSCGLHRPCSKLWRQSATGTLFRSTFAWQWKQQCRGTVLWADVSELVLFEAPSPPAWQREERVQWAAECLGTCLRHPACSLCWSTWTQKNKAV